MEDKPLKISIVGKGGVGKTAITALIAKVISQMKKYKLLLIDADPTHPHLCNMVKMAPKKSLEEIRLEAIKNASKKEKKVKDLAEKIDFNVYEGMSESKDFCLFSIGQPEGPGCFCPSNTLLRKVLESISKDFDIILIDCEAGLEQINRKVLKSVDILLIVTDISQRSIETANSIKNSAKKFTSYKKLGIIINKVQGDINPLIRRLEELELPIIGQIPFDENILKYDLEGIALIELTNESSSIKAVHDVVDNLLEF